MGHLRDLFEGLRRGALVLKGSPSVFVKELSVDCYAGECSSCSTFESSSSGPQGCSLLVGVKV